MKVSRIEVVLKIWGIVLGKYFLLRMNKLLMLIILEMVLVIFMRGECKVGVMF